MPHVCYAHNSINKLLDLQTKSNDIIIPDPNHFYDYKLGQIKFIKSAFPDTQVDYNYSILEPINNYKSQSNVTTMVKTKKGEIYLYVPYNTPIFLVRRH